MKAFTSTPLLVRLWTKLPYCHAYEYVYDTTVKGVEKRVQGYICYVWARGRKYEVFQTGVVIV